MGRLWAIAALLAFSSCASLQKQIAADCLPESGFSRGAKDSEEGLPLNFGFAQTCPSGSRAEVMAAYRDGYNTQPESAKALEAVPGEATPSVLNPVKPSSWVCEVEANSKVFTGIGSTREEALGSARTNCGSHVQANYCTKADCKQNL